MMGSSATRDRSKEAVGMMALHEALRSVCLNSEWTYSVFWTIRPRPRVRGGNACRVGDDSGSLMLMWEDGFCRGSRVGADSLDEMDGEDLVRKAFQQNVHSVVQLWRRVGNGLMGKVASDKCHKWVFKEPTECEPNISDYWQSSFDALPPEWTEQFESGIQTIAVIQAGHGLLQLGSCKIIPEDLHFVLRMRHTFESLGYQSGLYVSQLFSSPRNASTSMAAPLKQAITMPVLAPPFDLGPRNYQNPFGGSQGMIIPQKDEARMFLHLPQTSSQTAARMDYNMLCSNDQEDDIKWPNGLSFFNALTGRTEEATKLLFDPQGAADKTDHSMDYGNNKFKRSFTLPARMDSSSSSASLHRDTQVGEHRNDSGTCNDVMGTFLE